MVADKDCYANIPEIVEGCQCLYVSERKQCFFIISNSVNILFEQGKAKIKYLIIYAKKVLAVYHIEIYRNRYKK